MTNSVALAVLLAAWVGSLVGLHVPGRGLLWPAASAGALVCSAVTLIVRRLIARRSERTRRGSAADLQSPVIHLICLVAAVSCSGAGVRAQAINGGPAARLVADGVDRRVAVRADLTVVGDPLNGVGGRHRLPARLASLQPLAHTTGTDSAAGMSALVTRERVLLIVAPAADSAAPPVGQRLRVTGVLEVVPEPAQPWTRSLGILVQFQAANLEVRGGPGLLQGWANQLRVEVGAAAHAALDPAAASLLTGLTTGDLTGQPEEIADQVDRSGLRHLVAVSGSNIALIVGATVALVLAAGWGRRAAWWLGLVAIWWLVLVVRTEPSVIRASLMATLVIGGLLVGRARSAVHVLAVAGTTAILLDPLLASRLGFVLSMGATAGVLGVTPLVVQQSPSWVPTPLSTLVGATVGAQAAVAPVLLAIGSPLHPASLFANLVAVPAASVGGLIGAITAAASILSPSLAALAARTASPALSVVLWAARTFASEVGRDWSMRLLAVGGLFVVGTAGRHVWSAHTSGRIRHAGVIAALGSVVLLVAVWPWGGAHVAPPEPTMVVLDVGQGDAVLLGDPVAGWMLIDGGAPDAGVMDALADHRVGRLRRVVATHADADHVGGLAEVVTRLPVDQVSVGPRSEDAAELRAAARTAGVPVDEAAAGTLWQHGDVTVRVLSPPPTGLGRERNNNSLVLRVDGAGESTSVLLPGDAEVIAQRQMLTDPTGRAALDVDVLLVPHHGGNTNAEGFLAATTPELAIISVGESNPFGHPHPDVLADLVGIDVRRTDQDGDVVVPLN